LKQKINKNNIQMNNDNQSFIHLPSDLNIEGNFKTAHSVNVNCNFSGILFSKNKITIEASAKINGDIICSEIIVNGKINGNIFCTGKVYAKHNCEITGSVYANRFENDESTNLDCVITVPKSATIQKIIEMLNTAEINQNFSADKNLPNIINLFKNNLSLNEPQIINELPITAKNNEPANKKVSVLGMSKWSK
jgi:hypothetical protein